MVCGLVKWSQHVQALGCPRIQPIHPPQDLSQLVPFKQVKRVESFDNSSYRFDEDSVTAVFEATAMGGSMLLSILAWIVATMRMLDLAIWTSVSHMSMPFQRNVLGIPSVDVDMYTDIVVELGN